MNSGDVYILDADSAIYVWNGAASNPHERAKAADVASGMAADRGGGVRVVTVADDDPDEDEPFWKLLPGERRFLGIKYYYCYYYYCYCFCNCYCNCSSSSSSSTSSTSSSRSSSNNRSRSSRSSSTRTSSSSRSQQ